MFSLSKHSAQFRMLITTEDGGLYLDRPVEIFLVYEEKTTGAPLPVKGTRLKAKELQEKLQTNGSMYRVAGL